jgi:hypothetical protein
VIVAPACIMAGTEAAGAVSGAMGWGGCLEMGCAGAGASPVDEEPTTTGSTTGGGDAPAAKSGGGGTTTEETPSSGSAATSTSAGNAAKSASKGSGADDTTTATNTTNDSTSTPTSPGKGTPGTSKGGGNGGSSSGDGQGSTPETDIPAQHLLTQKAQPGWTMDERVSDAAAVRDQAFQGTTGKARGAAWTAAVHNATGEIAATCSGMGDCAEGNILRLTGWQASEVTFIRAMRLEDRKDGFGRLWQEKEICVKCQAKYPMSNFIPGVLFAVGGLWSKIFG